MKLIQQKSDILDPKPVEQGFIVGKYDDPMMYAAVPISGSTVQLAVVHQANVLKVCRNRQSALNFIDRHRKKKSVAKLPL
jgi:predicted RNA-binding Zn ribbon-like protein